MQYWILLRCWGEIQLRLCVLLVLDSTTVGIPVFLLFEICSNEVLKSGERVPADSGGRTVVVLSHAYRRSKVIADTAFDEIRFQRRNVECCDQFHNILIFFPPRIPERVLEEDCRHSWGLS